MKIFLRLEMVSRLRAVISSLIVCQTLGNGDTIRCRIGTPVKEEEKEEVYREKHVKDRRK